MKRKSAKYCLLALLVSGCLTACASRSFNSNKGKTSGGIKSFAQDLEASPWTEWAPTVLNLPRIVGSGAEVQVRTRILKARTLSAENAVQSEFQLRGTLKTLRTLEQTMSSWSRSRS